MPMPTTKAMPGPGDADQCGNGKEGGNDGGVESLAGIRRGKVVRRGL